MQSARAKLRFELASRVKDDERQVKFMQDHADDAGLELDERVCAYLEQHSAENLSYSEALQRVMDQSPGLTARFNEQTAEKAMKKV